MSAQRVAARRIGIAIAVAAAFSISACAAGQQAQTANEKPSLDGTNATVGSIDISGLAIEAPSGATANYPKGSDLPVRVVFVNNAQKPDELTSITSPVIRGWAAYSSTADATAVLQAQSGSSASPSASAAPLPSADKTVPIVGNGRVGYATPEAKGALLLTGTTKPLSPGSSIPLTFTFRNAGRIVVQVPIALSSSPPTSVVPAPASSKIEG